MDVIRCPDAWGNKNGQDNPIDIKTIKGTGGKDPKRRGGKRRNAWVLDEMGNLYLSRASRKKHTACWIGKKGGERVHLRQESCFGERPSSLQTLKLAWLDMTKANVHHRGGADATRHTRVGWRNNHEKGWGRKEREKIMRCPLKRPIEKGTDLSWGQTLRTCRIDWRNRVVEGKESLGDHLRRFTGL